MHPGGVEDMRCFIMLSLLCLWSLPVTADYYKRHAEGYWWYQDSLPKEDETAPEQKAPEPSASPPAESEPAPFDPVKALEEFQQKLEHARAAAILNPSPENIQTYMELNNRALGHARNFANAAQQTIWTTPELDLSLRHPVYQQAVHAFKDERRELVDSFLFETAKSHGLFFFFEGSCPFCHKFAPILKFFAEFYGFEVIPVTLDGGALPDFPNPRQNNAAGLNLKVENVPALFLVNPTTREIQPVAYGFVSPEELRQRIYTLLRGEPPNPLLQGSASR